MRASIVSTQRRWDSSTQAWANYHLAIGFASIYIFTEEQPDQTAFLPDRVKLTVCTPEYWYSKPIEPSNAGALEIVRTSIGTEKWKSPESITCRQIMNCNSALEQARSDAIDWLLHIDGDELFWCPELSVDDHYHNLESVSVDHITYCNLEAVVTDESESVSPGAVHFKKNLFSLPESRHLVDDLLPQKPYFLSYGNGKSATRVQSTEGAGSAHDFFPRDHNRWHTALVVSPAILHRPYESMSQFLTKHSMLSSFPDTLLGRQWTPPGIYAEARDLVVSSDIDGLIDLFHRKVLLSDAEFHTLQNHGFIMSIDGPLPFSS